MSQARVGEIVKQQYLQTREMFQVTQAVNCKCDVRGDPVVGAWILAEVLRSLGRRNEPKS